MEKAKKDTEFCNWIKSFSFSSIPTVSLLFLLLRHWQKMFILPWISSPNWALAFLTPSLYGRTILFFSIHPTSLSPLAHPCSAGVQPWVPCSIKFPVSFSNTSFTDLGCQKPTWAAADQLLSGQSSSTGHRNHLSSTQVLPFNTTTCCSCLLWAHWNFSRWPLIEKRNLKIHL